MAKARFNRVCYGNCQLRLVRVPLVPIDCLRKYVAVTSPLQALLLSSTPRCSPLATFKRKNEEHDFGSTGSRVVSNELLLEQTSYLSNFFFLKTTRY